MARAEQHDAKPVIAHRIEEHRHVTRVGDPLEPRALAACEERTRRHGDGGVERRIAQRTADAAGRHDQPPSGRPLDRRRDDGGHTASAQCRERVDPTRVRADRLEDEIDETAAALAEACAERKTSLLEHGRAARGEHVARDADRRVLEVTPADGAVDRIGGDDHPRTGSAWHGAAHRHDRDEHGPLAAGEAAHERVDPVAHASTFSTAPANARAPARTASSSIERRISSAVAGVSSRGLAR